MTHKSILGQITLIVILDNCWTETVTENQQKKSVQYIRQYDVCMRVFVTQVSIFVCTLKLCVRQAATLCQDFWRTGQNSKLVFDLSVFLQSFFRVKKGVTTDHNLTLRLFNKNVWNLVSLIDLLLVPYLIHMLYNQTSSRGRDHMG